MAHLQFICELYLEQIGVGGFILHEHPWSSKSWDHECMQRLLQHTGVWLVRGDQCAYGAVGEDKCGWSLVQKATGWITNHRYLAEAVKKRCSNQAGLTAGPNLLNLNHPRPCQA